MVIWLSSYPRSGNTLFRLALKHLGIEPTYSIYDDSAFNSLSIKDFVGHESIDKSTLSTLHQDEKLYFVKTHEHPGDDSYPAIYIMRDGRDASVSLAFFMKDVESHSADFYSILSDVVSGNTIHGSWAEHVASWRKHQSKVVFVKFEELIQDPAAAALKALHDLDVSSENFSACSTGSGIKFDSLHAISPQFFRSGKSGNWRDIMPAYLKREFLWHQGAVLAEEGYMEADEIKKISGGGIPDVEIHELGFEMHAFEPITEKICMPPYHGENSLNDFNILMSIASQLNTDHIFEYGTAYGNTVANLCRHCTSSITTLNALPEGIYGAVKTYSLKKEEIGEVYRKSGFSERVNQIYEDSLLFVPEEHIAGRKFGLVIIDACHDFEYVVNDFLKIIDFVEPGGFVLFHDCQPNPTGHLKGVWEACRFLSSIGFDIKHIQDSWWGCWQNNGNATDIDMNGLLLLDHIVSLKRKELSLHDQIRIKEQKLDRIRKIPGYQFFSNTLRKLNIA